MSDNESVEDPDVDAIGSLLLLLVGFSRDVGDGLDFFNFFVGGMDVGWGCELDEFGVVRRRFCKDQENVTS
jgi:hypothetical protein